MGFFGHGGHLSKLGHKIGHTIEHYDEVLRSHNAPDIYIGGTYNETEGFTPNINISPNTTPTGITKPTAYLTKPTAYSRTTAKTAKDIAQGGMTKDEVVEFNRKHPNETMMRGQ